MKLRKQAPAKALIVAATAALLAGSYAAIHAEPRIGAEAQTEGQTPIDYQRFFAPGASTADAMPDLNPHIRTRAS